ncbi:unnamed protein product [Echinostoma caproni]|uniref:TPH domain-containing protein n=1 Tax=Echinostoma caproni TaxID=27848 RepID=A0A183AME7_9TREM|nr:unnamed protein product [Echinostoma caproni]
MFSAFQRSRPHSSSARFGSGTKSNLPNAPKGDNPNKTRRYSSACSLSKESEYWLRRQAQDSARNEEIDRLKQSLEEKDKKTEQNREEKLRERQRQLISAQYTLQKARERALTRQSVEKQRLMEEHRQLQQKEEEWRKSAEAIQRQKQESIQRFLDDREARIQEVRQKPPEQFTSGTCFTHSLTYM